MIYYRGIHEMTGRYRIENIRKMLVVKAVYRGANLVWTAIRSCFGAGYWLNSAPWLDDEGWKNN
jgi:hypothetical protein